MSKISIIKMQGKFKVPTAGVLSVFVTTNHDKHELGEGNGGVIVIARDVNHARELVDRELIQHGLLPHAKNMYTLRPISTTSPYSELISDAPLNGGPRADSKKSRAVPPPPRPPGSLGSARLYVSWDHHSHVPGVAGAIMIADSDVLAGELLDASLSRRGLLPNHRRSYSVSAFPLSTPFVAMLVA